MARLPIPGNDEGAWGNILNEFLSVEHNDDGTLKASGTIASKADDSAVVHDTGNETIDGIKTFNSSPIVPTPTTASQAATKAYVDSAASGDVTGPASSTDESIARFDGTTGKVIQNGANATLTDAGVITAVGFNSATAANALQLGTGGGDTRNVINLGAGGSLIGQVNGHTRIRSAFASKQVQLMDTGDTTITTSIDLDTGNINTIGGLVVNENGTGTADMRVEGDTDANLLFTDASADAVGVGTNTPSTKLSVEGVISTKAGTSTGQIAKVGGKISSNTTTVGNVGAGEDDLMTYSVPANTLATNQDSLSFRAVVVIANNLNSKRVRVKFGATTILDTGAGGIPVSSAINIVVSGEIIRTGATTQLCSVIFSSDNATLSPATGFATATETLSGAVTLKITGEAVANDDISQKSMTVRWDPAP